MRNDIYPLFSLAGSDESRDAKTFLGSAHRIIRSALLRNDARALAANDHLLPWLLQKLHSVRDVSGLWLWLRDLPARRSDSSLFHTVRRRDGDRRSDHGALYADHPACDRGVSLATG